MNSGESEILELSTGMFCPFEWTLPSILEDIEPVKVAGYPGDSRMETTSAAAMPDVSLASLVSTSSIMNGAMMMTAGDQSLKRKCPSIDSSLEIDDDDDGTDTNDVKRFARQNHSEIEKRRRDKMNTYIIQLSTMLPMCNAMNRKLDKLTVLRMAVQHMKTLRGASTPYTEASHKPSFLSDDELKHIILEAADGFLFVVGCDRARILYVSESVQKILRFSRSELIGQSLFDYIHPLDISKVKEQFSSSDLAPRERLIDAKTLMPVKTEMPQRPTHLCSGARRSFYCRMKYRTETCDSSKGIKLEKEELEYVHRKRKSDQKSYTVIHFTGYLKSWPTSKINISSEDDLEDNCNLSCLVAIGQIRTPANQNSSLVVTKSLTSSFTMETHHSPMDYMFRVTMDGKLSFIDQATTVVLGYLPQELLGTSVYEYYHQDDITRMAEIHRKVLDSKEKLTTGMYRFKSKGGSFLHVRSTCFSFRNPWTKEVEYIVSTNTVVPREEVSSSCQGYESTGVVSLDTDCSTADELSGSGMVQEKLGVPGLPGGTRLGAGRIGRQIADEIIESSRRSHSPQVVDSTNTDLFDAQMTSKRLSCLSGSAPQTPVENNPRLGVATPSTRLGVAAPSTSVLHNGPNGFSEPTSSIEAQIHESSTLIDTVIEEQGLDGIATTSGTDDGDEAAMSMIMSLLEADAGLGGPIDFNDLPWPL